VDARASPPPREASSAAAVQGPADASSVAIGASPRFMP
jgi:hypothetical protein